MILSSAAFYCQKVNDFIRHIYEDKGFRGVHYLDDFGFATMWEKAHNAQAVLKDLIRSSGLVDSVDKEVPQRVLWYSSGSSLTLTRLLCPLTEAEWKK